jgi:hypothetical protein
MDSRRAHKNNEVTVNGKYGQQRTDLKCKITSVSNNRSGHIAYFYDTIITQIKKTNITITIRIQYGRRM